MKLKSNRETYNIAVLDDHDLIAEAIKSMLSSNDNFVFVGGFTNQDQLVSFLKEKTKPDILLLDIHLKDQDGLKICKMLNSEFPSIKIVMLTSLTQQSIVSESFKSGAKGYLPKNVGYIELIECFETVLGGKIYIHKDISFVPNNPKKSSSYDYLPRLTRREKEILQLILDEFTTQEIADKLCLTVSTIETHRSSLLAKTGAKNVVGLIKYTLERGLLSTD